MTIWHCIGAMCLIGLQATQAACAQEQAVTLVLGPDYRFVPSRVVVPANSGFRLLVRNESGQHDRIGSDDLNVERGAVPGETTEIAIGPLRSGAYSFFGYRNKVTAKAEIVVQ
ncbi:cupredoxin domain-containing protein [Lacisediminimonas profundi]|uniref:cupredoxin domain-containing protein n=1 Tax=Lacisediminimonas profundi TaxID=2603856 RepID=UPI001386C589|nr:cupredoxin domain-containing protein [Lacisediminimonas profundi]